MKKSQPKLILNIGVENSELEEKVAVAMNEYAERVVYAQLDSAIEKVVNKRIDCLINGPHWDSRAKLQGKSLSTFINEKTEAVIADTIEKNAKKILAQKLAALI